MKETVVESNFWIHHTDSSFEAFHFSSHRSSTICADINIRNAEDFFCGCFPWKILTEEEISL
jgi:hypothetical protein